MNSPRSRYRRLYLCKNVSCLLLQGAMLLMMGTADELPKEPVQKTVCLLVF